MADIDDKLFQRKQARGIATIRDYQHGGPVPMRCLFDVAQRLLQAVEEISASLPLHGSILPCETC
jgi:hypothetical protein